jgi:hypothetical protein
MGLSTQGTGVFGASTSGLAGELDGPVVISGPLVVTGGFTVASGALSTALGHPDGSQRRVYGLASAEPYLEDFGAATLTGGTVRVMLDSDFAALAGVASGGSYSVHLSAEGDSNGLYVSHKDATGFEVREQRGGTSTVAFSYRVVAKRPLGAGARLERVAMPGSARGRPPTIPALSMQEVPKARDLPRSSQP